VTGIEVGGGRNRKTPIHGFFAVIKLLDPRSSGGFGVEGGRETVGEVKAVRSGQAASPEVAGVASSWPAKRGREKSGKLPFSDENFVGKGLFAKFPNFFPSFRKSEI
jgi:hypothetical protein